MACFKDFRAPAAPSVLNPPRCPACMAPPPVARWSPDADGRPVRRWTLPAHTHH